MTQPTIGRLTDTASRLSNVLKRETEVLKTARPKEIQALRQEKEVLANMYVGLMAELREEGVAQRIGNKEQAELRRLAHKLNVATEANAIALQAAIYANQRLGETVATAVRNDMIATQTYGSDGRLGGRGRKARAPLSYNRSL